MILRARCLLPIGQQPIDNAALLIESGRIAWLGKWRDWETKSGHEVRDLGEVAILPGLINAHCHLDYTHMAGKIPPPKSFPDWIKTILSLKTHWGYADYAQSWISGAKMLSSSGTTTVCDVESFPELLPEVWETTPMRVISFLEMTGVKDQKQADEVLAETLEHFRRLHLHEKNELALSPHALYSTTPELMRKVAIHAREQKCLLTTHVAESESEYEMFVSATGPFYDWLRGQRSMMDCAQCSPIQLLHRYGMLGAHCLAVHANYLAPGDAELLAFTHTTVVHCPRSHAYFGHHEFPYEDLRKAGVNICIATDSLASCLKYRGTEPVLNQWHEMSLFAQTHPGVRPSGILQMATINPAKAIQKLDALGQIQTGAYADLCALDYFGPISEGHLTEEILFNPRIREVLISGNSISA